MQWVGLRSYQKFKSVEFIIYFYILLFFVLSYEGLISFMDCKYHSM